MRLHQRLALGLWVRACALGGCVSAQADVCFALGMQAELVPTSSLSLARSRLARSPAYHAPHYGSPIGGPGLEKRVPFTCAGPSKQCPSHEVHRTCKRMHRH